MPISINIVDLNFSYDKNYNLISNLTIDFYPGKIYVLTGPNGVGKSTLIKLISGELEPKSGYIKVCGSNAKTERSRHCAVVTQDLIKFPTIKLINTLQLCLTDNLRLSKKKVSIASIAQDNFSKHWLAPIQKYLNLRCNTIGLWVLQIVELFKALVKQYDIILLDEPFVNLSETAKKELCDKLEEIAKRGKIIILVTHEIKNLDKNNYKIIPIKCDARYNALNNSLKIVMGKEKMNCANITKLETGLYAIEYAKHKTCNIIYFNDIKEQSSFVSDIRENGLILKNYYTPDGVLPNSIIKFGKLHLLSIDRYRYNIIDKLSIKKNFEIMLNLRRALLANTLSKDTYLKNLLHIAGINYMNINEEVYKLSGGNQHRLLMVFSLMNNMQFLLIEEPFAGIYYNDFPIFINFFSNLLAEKTLFLSLTSELHYNYLKNGVG